MRINIAPNITTAVVNIIAVMSMAYESPSVYRNEIILMIKKIVRSIIFLEYDRNPRHSPNPSIEKNTYKLFSKYTLSITTSILKYVFITKIYIQIRNVDFIESKNIALNVGRFIGNRDY